jgi:murein L,D-transpeptidase YafK
VKLPIVIFSCIVLSLALVAAEPPLAADKVIVWKSERRLELLHKGRVIKTYRVALGGSPRGPKTQQGDQKTPEGDYIIDSRNPQSQFYKSLHVSYPNTADRAKAKAKGVSPGGDVFIHGLGKKFGFVGKAHSLHDWTLGCIAVTNEEIEEIWKLVPNGTPIELKP